MDFSAMAVATVQRELAELAARDAAATLGPREVRSAAGSSVVFTVRLDPAERAALVARATARGLKPSVLARNLIRQGLNTRPSSPVGEVLDQLTEAFEVAVAELRTHFP